MQDKILAQIKAERERQDAKFGVQNWPLINPTWAPDYEILAGHSKWVCENNIADGCVNWADILHEEVYEALAERDVEKCKQELIQVAAVCVAIIESLDRNNVESK